MDFIEQVSSLFRGRRGIEIGGPSDHFSHVIPIYDCAASLDGVNFGEHTMWEGRLQAGTNKFKYGASRTGTQFIAEGTDLHAIKSGAYDFVLSSNMLEHVANPLRALFEWRRVLRPGGLLLLVLPDKDTNFDHRRPVTMFDHILQDFLDDVLEDDMTHLEEILHLHDLERDPAAGSLEQFRQRSLRNVENRGLHHHIFDAGLIHRILSFANFEILYNAKSPGDYCAVASARP